MISWIDFFTNAFGEVFFLFLCMCPILFVWQTIFAGKYMPIHHKICTWVFCLYLAGLLSFTGITTLFYGNIYFCPYLNIELLADLFVSPKQYIFNIALFVPLGFLLPLLWEPFRSQNKILLTGFFCSFVIEFLQMFCSRVTDVDDLLTNTIGAVLGYWLFLFAEQKTVCYQLGNQIPSR